MKIKISKSEWENYGRQAGWIKQAEESNTGAFDSSLGSFNANITQTIKDTWALKKAAVGFKNREHIVSEIEIIETDLRDISQRLLNIVNMYVRSI